jgi:hypothetical protein
MSVWLYVAACLLIPAAWGVSMARALGALDRRRKRAARSGKPPVDYSI